MPELEYPKSAMLVCDMYSCCRFLANVDGYFIVAHMLTVTVWLPHIEVVLEVHIAVEFCQELTSRRRCSKLLDKG